MLIQTTRRSVIPVSAGFPTLVSRGLNVYTTSGIAANVSSSNYNNVLTTTAATGTIWWDISTLTSAQKASMMLGWYGESGVDTTTLYFEPARATGGGGALNNIPTAYTIKGSTQASGGAAPTTGITTILTRSSNSYASRPEWFSATGYNWVGMDITSSSGSAISLKADLWDVSQSSRICLQVGDSRTWFGTTHQNPHGGSVSCDSLGNLMAAAAGFTVPQFNLGMSGAKAADINTLIAQWLTDFGGASGRIGSILLNVGVNDAIAQAQDSTWTTNYQGIVTQGVNVGAKVYCESIGDSSSSGVHANLPAYNSAIAGVVAGTLNAYTGYDEYTYFVNNPSQISGDQVHATDAGFAGVRTAKGSFYPSKV